ncbi:hypothetical protein BFS14_00945 [Serratia fonticola]|nr:hypothetical protein BFS14_00945 [Serratia fonticola]
MEVLHFTNCHMLPSSLMLHSFLFLRTIGFQENMDSLGSSKIFITKHYIIKYILSTHFMVINIVWELLGSRLSIFLNGKIELLVIPRLSMLVMFTGKLLSIVVK